MSPIHPTDLTDIWENLFADSQNTAFLPTEAPMEVPNFSQTTPISISPFQPLNTYTFSQSLEDPSHNRQRQEETPTPALFQVHPLPTHTPFLPLDTSSPHMQIFEADPILLAHTLHSLTSHPMPTTEPSSSSLPQHSASEASPVTTNGSSSQETEPQFLSRIATSLESAISEKTISPLAWLFESPHELLFSLNTYCNLLHYCLREVTDVELAKQLVFHLVRHNHAKRLSQDLIDAFVTLSFEYQRTSITFALFQCSSTYFSFPPSKRAILRVLKQALTGEFFRDFVPLFCAQPYRLSGLFSQAELTVFYVEAIFYQKFENQVWFKNQLQKEIQKAQYALSRLTSNSPTTLSETDEQNRNRYHQTIASLTKVVVEGDLLDSISQISPSNLENFLETANLSEISAVTRKFILVKLLQRQYRPLPTSLLQSPQFQDRSMSPYDLFFILLHAIYAKYPEIENSARYLLERFPQTPEETALVANYQQMADQCVQTLQR